MTSPDLSVPLHPCLVGSPNCGPACAKMVMEYYGLNYEMDEILSQLHVSIYGVVIMRLGTFLVERGLDVTLFFERETLEPISPGIDLYTTEFIESGGRVCWRRIDFDDIVEAQYGRKPVIMLLAEQTSIAKGHFVVTRRINETGVYVNDPYHNDVRRIGAQELMGRSALRSGLALVVGPLRESVTDTIQMTA